MSLTPSPFSFAIPNNLVYFKLFGHLLGKTILERWPISLNFPKYFLKLILNKKIYSSDIEEIDPQQYKNFNWFLDKNVENLDITFAYNLLLFLLINNI
jgi:hypothetical protein